MTDFPNESCLTCKFNRGYVCLGGAHAEDRSFDFRKEPKPKGCPLKNMLEEMN